MTVVLVLSGSGSTDRDGNAPGAPGKPTIYKVLGKAINDAGYATLRYDEPGIGKSATAVSKGVVNQEATPRRVAHVGILEFSGEPP